MQQRPDKPGSKDKGQSVAEDGLNPHGPQIDSELQTHIGRHLKQAYDDILAQDVPDRFVQLLQQLEQKTKAEPKGNG